MRTPRTDQAYTFQVIINNAREVTKAIRLPGPVTHHLDEAFMGVDNVAIYAQATDMVSAIQRAYKIANDAWRV